MRLWQKFCDSHVKFARNSYEIRTNFVRMSHFQNIHTFLFMWNSYEIRTNFVRISYEFRANLCEFLLIACESQ